ncbi:MAG TPA: TatD family hydrolase [Vicinamibacterales bacterium]|nr:TatD family hydrolase [Vicinamibacterales bacterium]
MTDSHCHLADEAFAADLDAVVTRAREAGVSKALCILSADEPEELARAPLVRQAWPDVEFAAAVHPHRAKPYAERPVDAAEATRAAIAATRAVAVGEIGLDYHYDFSPRDVQREVFAAQIALAVELDTPVVIHTREATDDTLAVLREAGRGRVRAVMHCFSGSLDDARRALELGFYISLAGILTFPKAGALRDVAAFVPDDRVLVETDAPFLAPVPHRGKRNEPAWVAETLKQLAALRSQAPEEMSARVTANFDAFVGRRVDTPAKPMV